MLDAGIVQAVLEGKFDPAGFERFDAAMRSAAASAGVSEAKIAASTTRTSAAMKSAATAAEGSATRTSTAMRSAATATESSQTKISTAATRTSTAVTSTGAAAEKGAVRTSTAMKSTAAAAEQSDAKVTAATERTSAALDSAATAAEDAAARTSSAARSTAAVVEGSDAKITAATTRTSAAVGRMGSAMPLAAMDAGSKHAADAKKNIEKLGTAAATTAKWGFAGLAIATGYAVTKAVSFNREMLKIQTQAGSTADEVHSLSHAILALATELPQSPEELAEGLYHIQSAGFRGAQSLELLKAAAQGAALGGAQLQDTTQAMIAATASQIKGVHGAADAMGQLNAIVGVGDMRMEQLAQAMATGILPTAHEAGLSLKDVGAALATVTDNATPANVTATRLRMTLALMTAPSKAAAKELESIGMSSTTMAEDMRKPNGLLLAIEDLKKHLHDTGKSATEQDAVLTKVFGGGKSSAVIMTLMGELDRLRSKYQQLGEVKGPQRLQESWTAFQHEGTAAFSEFKSSVESAAIMIGDMVLPEFAKLAHGASSALGAFLHGGGAAQVASVMAHAWGTLGTVAGNVVPILLGLGKALYAVGSALDVGSVGHIEMLLAAFLAFRAAAFVAPILMTVAGAMGAVYTAAATAPTLAAFGGDLLAMVNPVTAAVVGFAALTTGILALTGVFDSNTSEAERNAAAVRRLNDETERLQKTQSKTIDARQRAEEAAERAREAKERHDRVEKEVTEGKVTPVQGRREQQRDYREVTRNRNEQHDAEAEAFKSHEAEQKEAAKTTDAYKKEAQAIEKRIAIAKRYEQVGNSFHKESWRKQALEEEGKLIALQERYMQHLAETQLIEENLRRRSHGLTAITPENAPNVASLQGLLKGVSEKVRIKYELDDQNAQAKLGELGTQLAMLGHAKWVAQILTNAPSAGAAIAAMRAILAGVPHQRVVHILHNAPSARAAVEQLTHALGQVHPHGPVNFLTNVPGVLGELSHLQGNIDALHGKAVTITTVAKTVFQQVGQAVGNAVGHHAAGRRSGASELSLVGEGQGSEYVVDAATGQGVKVDRPTLMGLGPADYVVPLEDRYRGRALGLFMSLARDLEVPGYKKGKKGKHDKHHYKHRQIPGQLDPLSLPVSDIEQKASKAASDYQSDKSRVKQLRGQISTIQHRLAERDSKGVPTVKGGERSVLQKELASARADLAKRHSQVPRDHRALVNLRKELAQAKAYEGKIKRQTDLANIAANKMRLADGREDEAGFEAAQGERKKALEALQGLLAGARKHVNLDSAYGRQLTQEIQSAQLEGQSLEREEYEAPKTPAQEAAEREAEEEESSGMTKAERERLAGIKESIALAALTPGLSDDEASAKSLVSFLEGVLGEAQAEPAARGGAETITQLAEQVKTARSNVEAFAGGGENSNADLQAQINQANERAQVAQQQAQVAERALQVFSGSGDIGAGGPSALAAAGGVTVNQTINTLHPGDPQTLDAIGKAATRGIGLQGNRQAHVIQVGV